MMNSSDMKTRVKTLESEFLQALDAAQNPADLEALRIHFLGRKGIIADLFKQLATFSVEDKRGMGKDLNRMKQEFQSAIGAKQTPEQKKEIRFDHTLPGEPVRTGTVHPITTVLRRIVDSFHKMGFSVAQGPEVETDYYNFEALNFPEAHPARDTQDTLYVGDEFVLRTHTSPVQVRVMESQPPPVRIIAPGRCFRRDTPDATHSPFFHQVEGLCVDEDVTFADLKGVILNFARCMFGSDMEIRFRPSYFPFTEPSAEYDFSCFCRGKGCRSSESMTA